MPVICVGRCLADVLGSLWPLISFYAVNPENHSLGLVWLCERDYRVPVGLDSRFELFVYAQILWMLAVFVLSLILLRNHKSVRSVGQSKQVSTQALESALIQQINDIDRQSRPGETNRSPVPVQAMPEHRPPVRILFESTTSIGQPPQLAASENSSKEETVLGFDHEHQHPQAQIDSQKVALAL